jgi:putative oxidoreductase
MNLALLGLRVVVGLVFLAHGAQKLFGAFGGGGIEGTGESFEQIGLRPGRLNAWAAGTAEFFGGGLIALGLLTPFVAAGLIAVMTTAVLVLHLRNGFFNTNGGFEYNLVLVATAFALAGIGPGDWSLDNAFNIELTGTGWALGALGVGVLVGIGGVLIGRSSLRRQRPHGQPGAA